MAATHEQTHPHSGQPPQQPPPPEAEDTHPYSEQPPQQPPPPEAEDTHPYSEQPPQQPQPPPPGAEDTHPYSEQPPQQPPPEAEDTHPNSEQPPQQPPPPEAEDTKKWGTHIMGTPAAPNVHPDNQQAALWKAGAADHQQIPQQQPYVQHSPIDKHTNNPFEPVIQANIWYNLKAGHSVPEAAWGKVNLTAKALSGGGFESLFKQIFATDPNEKLKKTFACYLSTSTGPVAGTQYLSTARLAFCSDRPLTFTSPSGQAAWSYYKVSIPLGNISTVNPVVTKENPPEKYIQIATTDGHEFWFMGFVNFDKASHHVFESVADFRTAGDAVQQVQPVPG
ncbi:unnamed protein product [Malus baccata var. baccata]